MKNVVQQTANTLDIHLKIVKKINTENSKHSVSSQLSTSGKKRKCEKFLTSLDTFEENAIRIHVYMHLKKLKLPYFEKTKGFFRKLWSVKG